MTQNKEIPNMRIFGYGITLLFNKKKMAMEVYKPENAKHEDFNAKMFITTWEHFWIRSHEFQIIATFFDPLLFTEYDYDKETNSLVADGIAVFKVPFSFKDSLVLDKYIISSHDSLVDIIDITKKLDRLTYKEVLSGNYVTIESWKDDKL